MCVFLPFQLGDLSFRSANIPVFIRTLWYFAVTSATVSNSWMTLLKPRGVLYTERISAPRTGISPFLMQNVHDEHVSWKMERGSRTRWCFFFSNILIPKKIEKNTSQIGSSPKNIGTKVKKALKCTGPITMQWRCWNCDIVQPNTVSFLRNDQAWWSICLWQGLNNKKTIYVIYVVNGNLYRHVYYIVYLSVRLK